MKKELKSKGTVYFFNHSQNEKHPLMHYEMLGESESFQSSLMSTFNNFCFTNEEKQMLSLKQRRNLSSYMHLNPFKLHSDAYELVMAINTCDMHALSIEASDYGAFVCIAAIYSGKIDPNKKLDFYFNHSPVGLFPRNFMKSLPKLKFTINYKYQDNSWIDQFETLCANKLIPIKRKKVA